MNYPNGDVIAFDRKVRTPSGWIPGVDVISKPTEIAHYGLETKPEASEMKISPPKVNFHEFHESIGHPNNAITRNTAKAHGIDLEGPGDKLCASCVLSKAQKKPISKQETLPKAKLPAERLFLNISGSKNKSLGGNKFWLLVLDDVTDNSFSFFLTEKSQTTEVMLPFLKLLHTRIN